MLILALGVWDTTKIFSGRNLRGAVANVLHNDIIVTTSWYYVHFWTRTLGKVWIRLERSLRGEVANMLDCDDVVS